MVRAVRTRPAGARGGLGARQPLQPGLRGSLAGPARASAPETPPDTPADTAKKVSAVAVSKSPPLPKLILLGLIAGLAFHIFAGLKHILMDFHLGDSVAAARRGSAAVIVLTILFTGLIGAILW